MLQADGLAVNPLTSEISPDGRWGVVMCRSANALTIIDLDRVEITGTVALEEDSAPLGGTFLPSGDRLFVPLPGRDAVAVISVPGFGVEAMIPVGRVPWVRRTSNPRCPSARE